MKGSFGVFCGIELISGTFGDDVDADEHMRDIVRAGSHDAWELEVREVPEDYDLLWRLLSALRASRSLDLQQQKEGRDAAA